MTTGEKIKLYRKRKGLTQEELGQLVGVQKAAINKYETGVVVNIKRSIIAALAKALDVSPVDLLDDDSSARPADTPQTPEARIVSGILDRMPPEARQRALQLLSLAFSEYFKEDPDHDA